MRTRILMAALLVASPAVAQDLTYRQRLDQMEAQQLAAQAAALAAACQAAKAAGTTLPAGCQ